MNDVRHYQEILNGRGWVLKQNKKDLKVSTQI